MSEPHDNETALTILSAHEDRALERLFNEGEIAILEAVYYAEDDDEDEIPETRLTAVRSMYEVAAALTTFPEEVGSVWAHGMATHRFTEIYNRHGHKLWAEGWWNYHEGRYDPA